LVRRVECGPVKVQFDKILQYNGGVVCRTESRRLLARRRMRKSLSTMRIPRFIRLGQFIGFVGRGRLGVMGIWADEMNASGFGAEKGR
jgi:hypothetical protein